MMLMLRDDRVIELFDSPLAPPAWIEAIDIENGKAPVIRYYGLSSSPT